MLKIYGTHDGRNIFCDVVLMPLVPSDGASVDVSSPAPPILSLKALVDTGATSTSVNPSIIRQLGLDPIGMTEVETVNGNMYSEIYLVHIGFFTKDEQLPNMLMAQKPIEALGLLEDEMDFDVLLGMDVLSMGVFTLRPKSYSFAIG